MEPSLAAHPRLPHGRQSSPATALPGSALAVTPDGTTRNRTSAGANAATGRIAHSSPAADSKIFSRPGASDSPRAPLRPRSRHRLVFPATAAGSDKLVPDGTADHLRSPDTAGWPRVATNGEPRHYTPLPQYRLSGSSGTKSRSQSFSKQRRTRGRRGPGHLPCRSLTEMLGVGHGSRLLPNGQVSRRSSQLPREAILSWSPPCGTLLVPQ